MTTEPTVPAPPTCGCCTFGNHAEPCTCDGNGCCHPGEHRRRAEPDAEDAPTELGTPAASPNETGAGVGASAAVRIRVLREILNRLDGNSESGDSATDDLGAATVRVVLAEILAGMQPTPAPSASRETTREAIAGALAQTDGICGMDHGFTGSDIPCIGPEADAIIDAVLAVRDGEMQQLRADLAAERGSLARWLQRLATERTRAETAEATVADYENRITWETTCGEHAKLLDACRAADELAEEAEGAIARVRAECDAADRMPGTDGATFASAYGARIMASRIRTALTAPHGPAGQGDGDGR